MPTAPTGVTVISMMGMSSVSNPLEDFLAWNNELHAARKTQLDTLKRFNALTPEHNGRVQAEVVDESATLCCATDSAHGMATVYIVVAGDLFELCPDCAAQAINGMLRDGRVVSDSNDLIDVEVYR